MHHNKIEYFKELQKEKQFKHRDLILAFKLIDLKIKNENHIFS
jgi:hypothetical protein